MKCSCIDRQPRSGVLDQYEDISGCTLYPIVMSAPEKYDLVNNNDHLVYEILQHTHQKKRTILPTLAFSTYSNSVQPLWSSVVAWVLSFSLFSVSLDTRLASRMLSHLPHRSRLSKVSMRCEHYEGPTTLWYGLLSFCRLAVIHRWPRER